MDERLGAMVAQFDEMLVQAQEISQMMDSRLKLSVKSAHRRPAYEDRYVAGFAGSCDYRSPRLWLTGTFLLCSGNVHVA